MIKNKEVTFTKTRNKPSFGFIKSFPSGRSVFMQDCMEIKLKTHVKHDAEIHDAEKSILLQMKTHNAQWGVGGVAQFLTYICVWFAPCARRD